ncbi:MAG TPA: hypothetical protein VK943_04295, partial [Arenibaculum sp.]|nr:hypothetical protein [Arenibaculum sp.]
QFAPLTFDVARIDVVDRRETDTSDRIHADLQAPTPPERAVRRWVEDRLRAGGTSGTLTVVIEDASIIETPLPGTPGLRGTLTTEQTTRFDGRIAVELVVDKRERRYQGFTKATSTRSTTLAENASLYQRDATLLKLVRDMMDDMNYRLETGALTHLSAAIRR